MRFEHIIEINSPSAAVQVAVPGFMRAQLWQGMLFRVQEPGRFPLGPERCDWTRTDEGLYQRTLHFGQLVMRDQVEASEPDSLIFTPEAHGDTTPIRLTMRIEEPGPGHMVLRFIYESLGELSAEETYYNDYRQSAWLANDRDMVRTLRQWLNETGL